MVKNLPVSAQDMGSVHGWRGYAGEGNGNPSSILALEIPWREEAGGLQSMES